MTGWSWDTALSGVVPPLISPLDSHGAVDCGALERLVDHILDGGGSGLFVLGGCGEGAWLVPDQRSQVVRAVTRAARGRVPVLAGVLLPATGPATEAARRCADEGADALVAGSPYYFAVDEDAQQRHVELLLGAVDLPVLLYNIPPATHHTLSPELAARLATESRVLGIKDSAGDMAAFARFVEIKTRRPDFRVLQGHERVMARSLLAGGDGLVPGLGNVAPAHFAALLRAARCGDVAEAEQLQAQIDTLGELHAHGHWLPALKAACAAIGIGTGHPAPPLAPATPVQRAAIEHLVTRHTRERVPA